MNLTAYFEKNGVPLTSKSPTISVWTLDGSVIVNGASMTEVASGFYYYNFTGYDHTEDYVMQALEPTTSVYVAASNDVDSQRSQGVIKQILGMVQSNFRMENQTYDSGGRLLEADIYTYENASDANADTSRLHSYHITATYDGSGNLSSYKVVDT